MKRLYVVMLFVSLIKLGLVAQTPALDKNAPAGLPQTLLETSEAAMASLNPEMRAFACERLMEGMVKFNEGKPSKRKTSELELLKDCFRYSLDIDGTGFKGEVQERLLDRIALIQPDTAEELSALAEPKVRAKTQARKIEALILREKYDEATQEITQLVQASYFPYRAVVAMLRSLPKKDAIRRQIVFEAALRNFEFQDPSARMEDLGTLVVRYWRDLPAKSVNEAIERLLASAKKESEQRVHEQMTLATVKGEAQFSNTYNFRLFELMPILRRTNPTRADALVEQNPQLASVLDRYSEGLSSLDASYSDSQSAPKISSSAITYRLVDLPSDVDSELATLKRKVREIVDSGAKNPNNALKDALTLPTLGFEGVNCSPRADALGGLAGTLWRTYPATAKSAIHDIRGLLKDLPPLCRAYYLAGVAGLYVRLKEDEEASSILEEGLKTAKELYETDTSQSSPNKAIKAYWPSTGVWRSVVILQARLGKEKALEMADAVTDPDIKTLLRIEITNAILGLPAPPNLVREQYKSGPGSNQTLPIPITPNRGD